MFLKTAHIYKPIRNVRYLWVNSLVDVAVWLSLIICERRNYRLKLVHLKHLSWKLLENRNVSSRTKIVTVLQQILTKPVICFLQWFFKNLLFIKLTVWNLFKFHVNCLWYFVTHSATEEFNFRYIFFIVLKNWRLQ